MIPGPRRRFSPGVMMMVCLVVGVTGCGKPEGGGSVTGLAPGTMKMVAVEPVDRGGAGSTPNQNPQAGNLLLCADFATWWSGAPAPNGLFPPDGSRSLISPAPGGGIRQEWARPEDPEAWKQRLRSQPVSVQPGTYQLDIVTRSDGKGPVLVTLWREDGDRFVPLPVEPMLILPGSDSTKRYSRMFSLDAQGRISVAAEAVTGTRPQTVVEWVQWSMKRAG